MIALSRKLSQNTLFLRVDWYEAKETLYLGELTFFPISGYGKFDPLEWDITLGSWITLPTVNE
jgi:hypothetical protein